MIGKEVIIPTPAGAMDSYVAHPQSGGPFPLVVMFMDVWGLREELYGLARRVAEQGYSPHRLVDRMRGEVYCGFGERDRFGTPEMVATLDRSFAGNRDVRYIRHVHAGADHGYSLPDRDIYAADATALGFKPLSLTGYVLANMTNVTLPTTQEWYEGIFTRIMAAYDIDPYWIWTPEVCVRARVRACVCARDCVFVDLCLHVRA